MSNQFIDNLKGKYITLFCSVENIGGPMLLKLKSPIAALNMYIMIVPTATDREVCAFYILRQNLKREVHLFLTLRCYQIFFQNSLVPFFTQSSICRTDLCPDVLSLIV